ncbi:MAG: NAD(P)H-binding protein [Thermoplasmata archaeon]
MDKKSILIVGGGGFIGSNISEILAQSHDVRYLARHRSELLDKLNISYIPGDITKPETLSSVPKFDIIIDLVAVIKNTKAQTHYDVNVKGVTNLVALAKRFNAKFVYFSAINADIGKTEYFQTKHRAEELVKESGLEYLIIRPSVVVSNNDFFVTNVKKVSRYGISINSGLLCPVYVKDLAKIVSMAIFKESNKILEISGPEKLNFTDMVNILRSKRGLKNARVLSNGLVRFTVPILSAFNIITKEQYAMITLNFCRDNEIWSRYGVVPKKFNEIL